MSISRFMVAALTVLAATAALTGTASAHVTIPEPAEKGGFSIVTFSVPNERDDAGTVTLSVQLPQDHPLAFVSVQPKPGWTAETTTRTLEEPIDAFGEELTEVTDTVTWTGGPIEPGQFDTFSISVGPLPDDVDALEFPAIQTYSSGEEVAWIEPTPEGGEEPENPAPVLRLLDPADSETTDTAAESDQAADAAAASETGTNDDDGTDGVAVAALVVAIIAVLLGGAALITGRRRTT
jgi:periplasmic copper chaperone A